VETIFFRDYLLERAEGSMVEDTEDIEKAGDDLDKLWGWLLGLFKLEIVTVEDRDKIWDEF
jgi:hypothetical protein